MSSDANSPPGRSTGTSLYKDYYLPSGSDNDASANAPANAPDASNQAPIDTKTAPAQPKFIHGSVPSNRSPFPEQSLNLLFFSSIGFKPASLKTKQNKPKSNAPAFHSLKFSEISQPKVESATSSASAGSAAPPSETSEPPPKRDFNTFVRDDDGDQEYFENRNARGGKKAKNRKNKPANQEEPRQYTSSDLYDPDVFFTVEQLRAEGADRKMDLEFRRYCEREARRKLDKMEDVGKSIEKYGDVIATWVTTREEKEPATRQQSTSQDEEDLDEPADYGLSSSPYPPPRAFAPPSKYNFAPPTTYDAPALASTAIASAEHATGEDAYAARAAMSQQTNVQSLGHAGQQQFRPPGAYHGLTDVPPQVVNPFGSDLPGPPSNVPPPPPPPPSSVPPPSEKAPRSRVVYEAGPQLIAAPPSRAAPSPSPSSEGVTPEVEDGPRSLRPGQPGFAERMMEKMGHKKGEGLGAQGQGITKALYAKQDKRKKKSDAEGGGFAAPQTGKIMGGGKPK
ncbi:MAG: hypothetical protein M1820_004307 [Bogoriella megaspora]|nr:MAG: hypothetical protein M1820_004307 [Bogoriella megaspora]